MHLLHPARDPCTQARPGPRRSGTHRGDDDSKELQGPGVGVPALRSTSRGLTPRLSKGSLSASGRGGVRPEGLGLRAPELMLRSAAEQAAGLTRMDCAGWATTWVVPACGSSSFPACEGRPGRAVCVCVCVSGVCVM